jgi:hypothetical protein
VTGKKAERPAARESKMAGRAEEGPRRDQEGTKEGPRRDQGEKSDRVANSQDSRESRRQPVNKVAILR